MIFQVGIENNNEGRSIAWALEHPGCYAYGMKAQQLSTTWKGRLIDMQAGSCTMSQTPG